MTRSQAWLCLAIGLAAGCAPTFPHPMTAQDLVRLDSGDALVAYLGQPDASPTVCDARASGPHLAHFDESSLRSLIYGLTGGRIDPGLWRRCVDGALDGASTEEAAMLVDAVGRGYRSLIKDGDLETSPVLQGRLTAMQTFYIERPNGLDGHPKVMGPIFGEIGKAFGAHKLGPVATKLAAELLAIVDLERGLYGGRAVDVALLDDLYSRGEETLLRRFNDRLPTKELRDEARRRVVQLEIAASPYAEVRADGKQVEARVLALGINRISLALQPASRASLDQQKIGLHGVLVRQDVWHQTATLLGTRDRPGVSVLPELSLKDALWVTVARLSRPVTLCRSPRTLDPSPCIGGDDVKIDSPLAYLDRGDAFHFVDHIGAADAAALAHAGHALALPVSVGGRRVLSFEWPLWFQRPENLILSATSGRGPDLKVTVDNTDPSRFSFTVSGARAPYRAVVDKADLPAFRLVSRGAAGQAGAIGTSGMDGSAGLDGSSASCPSMSGSDGGRGGDGGSGGPGGDGGPGGKGGDIQVQIDCGVAGCPPEVLDSLRRIIASEGGSGGPGGSGGSGGRGGRGGSGGSGTSCFDSAGGSSTSLGGGNSGMSGSDGANGSSGADGSPGRPGQVGFSVAHR
jgi:hypothetical protein